MAAGEISGISISWNPSLERRLGQSKPIRLADGRGSSFGGRIINIEHRTSNGGKFFGSFCAFLRQFLRVMACSKVIAVGHGWPFLPD